MVLSHIVLVGSGVHTAVPWSARGCAGKTRKPEACPQAPENPQGQQCHRFKSSFTHIRKPVHRGLSFAKGVVMFASKRVL